MRVIACGLDGLLRIRFLNGIASSNEWSIAGIGVTSRFRHDGFILPELPALALLSTALLPPRLFGHRAGLDPKPFHADQNPGPAFA